MRTRSARARARARANKLNGEKALQREQTRARTRSRRNARLKPWNNCVFCRAKWNTTFKSSSRGISSDVYSIYIHVRSLARLENSHRPAFPALTKKMRTRRVAGGFPEISFAFREIHETRNRKIRCPFAIGSYRFVFFSRHPIRGYVYFHCLLRCYFLRQREILRGSGKCSFARLFCRKIENWRASITFRTARMKSVVSLSEIQMSGRRVAYMTRFKIPSTAMTASSPKNSFNHSPRAFIYSPDLHCKKFM